MRFFAAFLFGISSSFGCAAVLTLFRDTSAGPSFWSNNAIGRLFPGPFSSASAWTTGISLRIDCCAPDFKASRSLNGMSSRATVLAGLATLLLLEVISGFYFMLASAFGLALMLASSFYLASGFLLMTFFFFLPSFFMPPVASLSFSS